MTPYPNIYSVIPSPATVMVFTGRGTELANCTHSIPVVNPTLATLINLLFCSYLTSSYTSASTFLSKVTYPDSSMAAVTLTSTTTTSTTSSNINSASSLNQLLMSHY